MEQKQKYYAWWRYVPWTFELNTLLDASSNNYLKDLTIRAIELAKKDGIVTPEEFKEFLQKKYHNDLNTYGEYFKAIEQYVKEKENEKV